MEKKTHHVRRGCLVPKGARGYKINDRGGAFFFSCQGKDFHAFGKPSQIAPARVFLYFNKSHHRRTRTTKQPRRHIWRLLLLCAKFPQIINTRREGDHCKRGAPFCSDLWGVLFLFPTETLRRTGSDLLTILRIDALTD